MPILKKIHNTLIFALITQNIFAIDITSFPLDDIIYDIYDNRVEGRALNDDFDAIYENLISLQQNPININQATQNQLEQLYFLTDEQIDAIILFINKNGPINSIYELQLINELELYDIRNIIPFITIGETEKQPFYWRDLFKYGKHEVTMRFDVRNIENYGNIKRQYTGDPFYTNLKYRYSFKDRIYIGFHAEKDIGEQFIGPDRYGFDSYGGYLQINNLKNFKTIVVGDYRASFGEGLVVNQQLSFGRAYDPLTIRNRNTGLHRYGGNDEFNFFRGIGATYNIANIDISAFYSFKTIDGNLSGNLLSSYSKTGYHRTLTEINHRDVSNQHVVGIDATYKNSFIDLGVTFIENIMKHSLDPANEYYFHGRYQSVGSLHYRFHNQHWSVFGETAIANNTQLGIATINGIKYHPMVDLGFALSHRYYSHYYDNMYASAISYKSRINNEQSIYFASDINIIRPLKISLSADIWDKYQFICLQTLIEKYQTFQTSFQARWKHRDNKHRLVFKANHTHFIGQFSTRSQIELNVCKTMEEKITPWTFGCNIAQRIEYKFQKPDITLQAGICAFYAPTYDNRFYIYENDVLYAFGMAMAMGRGIKTFINTRYQINEHWKIYLKLGNTWSVENKSHSDIHFLLRYTY